MPRSEGKVVHPVYGIFSPAGKIRRTIYLPHSRITRDWPMRTEIRLPNALSAMRKLRPLTAPLEPKTF